MGKDLNILCTICARGGSKGVKDKNIRPLLGKPLIAHTIEQAGKWGKAGRIVVSTDSDKIAEIAKDYGAQVPFMRPGQLAGDNVPKLAAVRHAAAESEKIFKEKYDITVDLDVSAPIRKAEDLDNCLEIFLRKRPEVLFSVVRAHRNPYFNMVEETGDGFVRLCKPGPAQATSRQTAPDVYDMNSSIYFYSRDFLSDEKQVMPFSDRTAVYVMDKSSMHDIDSEMDFRLVEFLMRGRK